MRLRVDIGKDPVSSRRLLVPVDGSSTVAELTRAVEDREHKRRKTTGEASIQIGEIQLRVQDGLCEVDPDDVLSDLVANDSQDAVFVAICSESGAGASGQEPSSATGSRSPRATSTDAVFAPPVGAAAAAESSPGQKAGGNASQGSGAAAPPLRGGQNGTTVSAVGVAPPLSSASSFSPPPPSMPSGTPAAPNPKRTKLAPIAPIVTPALS
ncbi:unnamed protein product, partial [Ectocarpus sp. 13 AM-2016]